LSELVFKFLGVVRVFDSVGMVDEFVEFVLVVVVNVVVYICECGFCFHFFVRV
jgi:hypothetical protein